MKKSIKKIIIVSVSILLVIGICVGSFLILRSIQDNTKLEDKRSESSNNNFMFFEEGFTDVKVTDEKSALEAVASVAEVIGISDVEKELIITSTDYADGDTFYRMQQQYNGIPVYGKEIVLSVNDKGSALGLNSNNVNDTVFENSNIEFEKLDSANFDVETVKAKAFDYFSDSFDEEVISVEIKDTNNYTAIVIDSENKAVPAFVCNAIVNVETDSENDSDETEGFKYSFEVLISCKDSSIIDVYCLDSFADAKTNAEDIDGKSCDINIYQKTNNKYILFDRQRNIRVYDAAFHYVNQEKAFTNYNDEIFMVNNEEILTEDNKQVILKTKGDISVLEDTDGHIVSDNVGYGLKLSQNNGKRLQQKEYNTIEIDDDKGVTLLSRIAQVYDFYKNILSRKGFNSENGAVYSAYDTKIKSGIDFDFSNAYSSTKLYKEATFLGFGISNSLSLDVIGHEFTHSVNKCIFSPIYQGESGAIDEAYADILGEIFEDYSNDGKLNGNNDWLLDKKRNIIDPSKNKDYLADVYGYPQKYKGKYWKKTSNTNKSNDYGGVHINSTVISHAAYLMNNGIDGNEGKKINTELLAKIWYKSMFLLHSDATFEQCANAVYTAAYNTKSLTKQQLLCVREAFGEVGLDVGSSLSCSVVKGTTVYALSADNKKYQNYHIKIVSVDNEKDIADVDIKDDKGYKLDLSAGTYMIAITDNQNKNGTKFYKKITLTEGTAIEGAYINILTDFEERQAEPTTVKPTEKPAKSANTTFTAEQLSSKSMPEIVDLMGGDFRHDHGKGVDYYTDGGFYIYNDDKLPGFIFYLKWDYSVTNDYDSQSTDEIKQKINGGFYQLNFIVMHDAAKLNDSFSADMTYQEFIAAYGYTVTKILPGAGFPGHALSNYKKGNISTVYVFYPQIDDSIYSTGTDTVSDDLISRYNPTIRSIVALPKKDIPAKSTSEESNSDVSSQSDSSADSIIMEDLLGAPESRLIELFGYDSYNVQIPSSGLPKCLTYNSLPNVAFGFSQTADEVVLVDVIDCEQTVRFTKDITSDMTGRQLLDLNDKFAVSEAYNEALGSYTVVVKKNNEQVIVFGWNDSDYMDKIPNFVTMQKIPS